MNELPAAVISQRLREGDRAAAFIPQLRGAPVRPSEPELREWHALIDLLLSGAVAPRKVFLRVDELYDPVKGDWSQALQSPGIQECKLFGDSSDLERAIGQEKKVLGDGKPDWAIRLALSLAKSSAHKLVLSRFLTQGMFMAFSQALRFNRTLQHLDVRLDHVTGTAWVSSILLYNSTLHTLVLRFWRPSLLEPLASSLPSNTTLRHLGLMCRMDDPSRTEEVLFFNALGRNRGLRSFAYLEEVLARDSCQALADALATNPTLVDVDLSFGSRLGFQIVVERGLLVSNNIVGLNLGEMTNPFAVCPDLLARVMAAKPIRRLNLPLSRDIADAPFLAMPTTNHLVELKITGRFWGEQAWRALADVVKRSASLRNLHVSSYGSGGSIPDTSLFCAIAKHPFLEEFDVEGIYCTVELAEIVKTHPSLTTIGCYIASVAEAQALIAAAKANPRLLKVKYHLSWVSDAQYIELREKVKPSLHVLHSYLEMNRHGRHKLLIEHPFLLADLLGSVIDFRTRINLVMENPEPLIQAIHSRSFDVTIQPKRMASKDRPVLSLE